MTRENIVVLRKVFPQHIGRLDACDQMLLHGQYNEAVSTVRNILKEEYNKAQEYAQAGKLAQDSSIIQSMREILLHFEKTESTQAGKELVTILQKEALGAYHRNRVTTLVLKFLNAAQRIFSNVEIPHEMIEYAAAVPTVCSKIIRDKNYRNKLVGDVKIWFWGGPRRQRVAETCSKIKDKASGWGRSLVANVRGFIGLSNNRVKLQAGG